MKKHQQGQGANKRLNDNYRDKGYEKGIITDAEAYFKRVDEDPGIKIIKNEFNFPHCKDLLVMDLSLSAKGPVEDRIYSDYPFYRNNLRRGNTLGRLLKGNTVHWLRKGLRKFFDVNLPALKGETKGDNEHFATFREIENVLSLNSQYEKEEDKAHVGIA